MSSNEWPIKHRTTCTDHQCTKLSESQTQEAAYCMIPFIWHAEKGKTIGIKRDWWLPGTRGQRGVDCKGARGSLGMGEVMQLFYILTMLVIKQLKSYRTILLRGYIVLYANHTLILYKGKKNKRYHKVFYQKRSFNYT